MAYVPGFHSDIFVSYASEDHDEHMVKFIDDLRLYLKRELGKLFPEESIFFDRRALNERTVLGDSLAFAEPLLRDVRLVRAGIGLVSVFGTGADVEGEG
jgi:hypothetical protein